VTSTFVSAELVAMGILDGLLPADRIVASTSAVLTPPLVRVRRVPGEARTMFDDPAHVEVMTFGATFEAAQELAEQCWSRIEFARATAAPLPDGRSITVDYTTTILPPFDVPWPDPDVRVFQATYLIVTRALPQ
jgi:hypothetical protein